MMNNNPNRKKSSNFDPFMLSLLSENKEMDPMLSMMMMNNKDMSKMGPLLPLFFSGKTKKEILKKTLLEIIYS